MAEIAGLKLIVPSSVSGSGVSVSASGKVTFTAASTMTMEDVFSSSYDNYLLVMRVLHDPSGATIFARFRVGGTDASGSDYVRQRLSANASVVDAQRDTRTDFQITPTDGTLMSGVHVHFYGPALAQSTAIRSSAVHGADGSRIQYASQQHGVSTAYTGLTLGPSSGTISGALTIYGLSQ